MTRAKNQTDYTNEQRLEIAKHYLENRSYRDTALKFNVSESSVERWVVKFRDRIQYGIKDNQVLKGVSTHKVFRDDDGNYMGSEWVKVDVEKQKTIDAIRDIVEGLKEEIPRIDPITPPSHINNNLASCYVLTDFHIGMLSWPEETGADWDTNKAYRTIVSFFKAAVDQSPPSHTAVLAQMGDFLHYDSLESVTPASGHVLDADTRFPNIRKVAIKAIREIVKIMLGKHENVHIIMAEGNHDQVSSGWMRDICEILFENEPRVKVDGSHIPYYCFEWGKTSLFFHHGHKKRIKELPELFSAHFREIYGRTKYSYGHTGHLHHERTIETHGMKITQHPTLAAPDAYAVRGGWLSKREASVIIYSNEHGKVSEIVFTPEMLE